MGGPHHNGKMSTGEHREGRTSGCQGVCLWHTAPAISPPALVLAADRPLNAVGVFPPACPLRRPPGCLTCWCHDPCWPARREGVQGKNKQVKKRRVDSSQGWLAGAMWALPHPHSHMGPTGGMPGLPPGIASPHPPPFDSTPPTHTNRTPPPSIPLHPPTHSHHGQQPLVLMLQLQAAWIVLELRTTVHSGSAVVDRWGGVG